MKRYLLFLIVFLNLNFKVSLKGQNASPATIHLSVLEKTNSQPIQDVNVLWFCPKTGKNYVFKTDNKGKTTVSIPSNDLYKVKIAQAPEEYTLELPNSSNFVKDISLQFSIPEKEIVAKPHPSHQAVTEVIETPKTTVKIIYQNAISLQSFNKPKDKILEIIDL